MCTRRLRFSLCRFRVARRKTLTLVGLGFFLVLFYAVHLHQRKTPTIFIIEEHHEALAYWFHAVDLGLIPKQGNVLIHIDGHSDESTPEFVTGMPLFRYTEDGRELSYFLQKNDVFIQGAVMTNLVSRVIWIWPSWDDSLRQVKEPYESRLVELGWFWEDAGAGTLSDPHFCQCETLMVPHSTQKKDCSYLNNSAKAAEEQQIKMPSISCHIETSYVSEHINEIEFIDKIERDRDWIKANEPLILDIDEDYFGCENIANSLTRDGLSWSVIESLDHKLTRFICPKSISHEEIGNSFVKSLLEPFLTNCRSAMEPTPCSFISLLSDAYNYLVSEFRSHPSMFCGQNDFKVRDAWKQLAEIFYELPTQHLKRIYDLGFCLSTAPKTLFFEDGRVDFAVCHGLNPPNSTIVFLHSPGEIGIVNRSKLLLAMAQSILQTNPLPLVTLCRSVRDGFTPRGLADFIENQTLEMLIQASDIAWEINYDDDLLGGRLGWNSRSSRQPPEYND